MVKKKRKKTIYYHVKTLFSVKVKLTKMLWIKKYNYKLKFVSVVNLTFKLKF